MVSKGRTLAISGVALIIAGAGYRYLSKMVKGRHLATLRRLSAGKAAPEAPAFGSCYSFSCFGSSRRLESFDLEDEDEVNGPATVIEVVEEEVEPMAASPAVAVEFDLADNESVIFSLKVETSGIVKETTGSIAAFVPAAALTAPVAPLAASLFEVQEASLKIELPDDEEIIEDAISCEQLELCEALPLFGESAEEEEEEIEDAAATAGEKKQAEVEAPIAAPILPDLGSVMTPAQVESYIMAHAASGTPGFYAPICWEASNGAAPSPPPVGAAIGIPATDLLDLLKASAARSANAAATAVAATARAGELKPAASLRVDAVEFLMPAVPSEPVDEEAIEFKNMLWKALLKGVEKRGGDGALLHREMAEARELNRVAAVEHVTAGLATFDPEAAMQYMINREKELTGDVDILSS
ncbi:hypothetical protein Ndes2526B_g00339 [Nannochloris sp. 'desiccata']|nr:hypothetical protein NADE_002183 [Chlorella desiccata (nom. nud.)]